MVQSRVKRPMGRFIDGYQIPIAHFQSQPFAVGYNGRTNLQGKNFLKKWILPGIKAILPTAKKTCAQVCC